MRLFDEEIIINCCPTDNLSLVSLYVIWLHHHWLIYVMMTMMMVMKPGWSQTKTNRGICLDDRMSSGRPRGYKLSVNCCKLAASCCARLPRMSVRLTCPTWRQCWWLMVPWKTEKPFLSLTESTLTNSTAIHHTLLPASHTVRDISHHCCRYLR